MRSLNLVRFALYLFTAISTTKPCSIYAKSAFFSKIASSIENIGSFITNVIGLSINERSSIENIGSFTTNVIGLSINERSSIENIGSFITNAIGLSINERSFVHNQISFTTNEPIFCTKSLYLAPSSPNPFSPRRRGTKSLAPLALWERGWG
ncbi:hypothetical protein FDUTEX481_05579 [Tolypothrix sp. PCC 7601]|nr:hypothetical protein FDUTEX481_05579 [Tolypothrix sp. PCC 7601]BAY88812.1 hypothetical protein NIES3275_08120 [Microchaete diplosiphon NIES-3275]